MTDSTQAKPKHHPLSPSKAILWVNCPGYAEAVKDIPETTNEAAAFGTAVHEWVDSYLKSEVEPLYKDQSSVRRIGELCLEELSKLVVPGEKIVSEVRVKLPITITKFDPIEGTTDIMGRGTARLLIADFKTGYKKVDAKENLQLISYALGSYEKLSEFQKAMVDRVDLAIIQVNDKDGPRTSVWSIPIDKLIKDYKDMFQNAVNDIESRPQWRNAGEHCTQGYCPASINCPSFKAYVSENLGADFDGKPSVAKLDYFDSLADTPPLEPITSEEYSLALKVCDVMEDWIKLVRDKAQARAVSGIGIPGRKLVQRFGHFKWIDEKEAVEKFKALGVFDKVSVTELVSPSQAKKKLKGTEGLDLEALMFKPSIGTKLVKADSETDSDLFGDE